jgi:hypothetical protein
LWKIRQLPSKLHGIQSKLQFNLAAATPQTALFNFYSNVVAYVTLAAVGLVGLFVLKTLTRKKYEGIAVTQTINRQS